MFDFKNISMNIGGFLKFSSVDDPGYLSCVIFTQGCNWRCPFCHNPELIPFKKKTNIFHEEVLEQIKERKNFLESVTVTGGEPTIQENLIEYCRELKNIGLRIKLDTNGSRFDIITILVKEKLIDFISIDIKTSPEKYFKAIGSDRGFAKNCILSIEKTLDLLYNEKMEYEIRTTVVPGVVEPDDITIIGKWIGGNRKYILQRFRSIKTLSTEFEDIDEYNMDIINSIKDEAKKYFTSVSLRSFV